MIDFGHFRLVKFDSVRGVLTTQRGVGRHEDIWLEEPGIYVCAKHYGDHDYESVGQVEAANLLDAAWKFHA